jgi:hypothetical protein
MQKNHRLARGNSLPTNQPTATVMLLTLTFILVVPFNDISAPSCFQAQVSVRHLERGITWDVTIHCSNTGGQNDYVIFGEAPDANDGPPPDSYDVVKPPASMPPYIRAWFNDNLPVPYDVLWADYRQYPDSYKVWNLTVHWMPSSGSAPTTITLLWDTADVISSEYTSVTLCTTDETPLQDMRVNSTYMFSCPAYVPQNFKILCQMSGNNPPVANPDAYSTTQDTVLSVAASGVLGNDTDPESDPLTAVKVADPSHGTLLFQSDGSFVYTPASHFFGTDSFTYKAYDGTSYSNTATVTLTIIPLHYTLTITCQGSGTVTKDPDQTWYTYGQEVNLTANPAVGWRFDHWGGDLAGSQNPTTIIMDENKTVVANFTQIHYYLTITVEGSGNVLKDPDQAWYSYGQVVTLTAVPSSGWVFDHWGGDLSGNTNPTTITMNGNKSVIANFTITAGYTLTIIIQGSGNVIKVPDLPSYAYGTVVNLTAVPSTGWVFNHWGGDLTGNANPTTITMTGNKTVIANFTAIHYTLTITIQGSGTVTKAPDQNWYLYGTGVTLTAVPNAHWMFHHWAGDLSGNTNPTTITMNGNKSVIANFTLLNHAPLTPEKPSGETNGKVGTTYTYTAVTTDPDNDQLWYQFDWGDGTTSTWVGPFDSGVTGSASHAWTKKGSYGIKVKAKDSYGLESNWSQALSVTMPLSALYQFSHHLTLIQLVIRFLKGEYPEMTILQVLRMEGWLK